MANFQKVYFDLNSSDLNDESRAALDENISIMLKESNLSIEIQGHADERGTTEYNIALGQRRADSVKQYLLTQGVPLSAVETVSYGEERPVVSGSSEEAWSQNRRAVITIFINIKISIKIISTKC